MPSDTLWPARTLASRESSPPDLLPLGEGALGGNSALGERTFALEVPSRGVWTLEFTRTGKVATPLAEPHAGERGSNVVARLALGGVVERRDLGEVFLPELNERRVNVVDAQRRPVVGALVAWRTLAGRFGFPTVELIGTTRSDHRGVAALQLPQLDLAFGEAEAVQVEVHAEGFAVQAERLEGVGDRSSRSPLSRISLREGAARVVQLVLPEASDLAADAIALGPAVHASALGLAEGLLPWAELASSPTLELVASVRLNHALDLLAVTPWGSTTLRVEPLRRDARSSAPQAAGSVATLESASARAVVERAISELGVVKSVPRSGGQLSGGPIASRPLDGAVVWWAHDPARFAVSDERGRIRLPAPAIPAEDPRLLASAVDHLSAKVSGARWREAAELELQPSVRQQFLVFGAGEPLSGVEVLVQSVLDIGQLMSQNVRSPSELEFAPVALGTTDADGSAWLSGLEPGRTYRAQAKARGWLPTAQRFVTAPVRTHSGVGASPPLLLDLQFGARYRGWVEDERGEPLAGATVTLVREPNEFSTASILFDLEDMIPLPITVASSADGSFLVEDLRPGNWALSASMDGWAPAGVQGFRVPIEDPEVLDDGATAGTGPQRAVLALGTLVLGRGGTVSGLVASTRERPIAGARVVASYNTSTMVGQPGQQAALSDAEGRFELSALPLDQGLAVQATARGFAPSQIEWLQSLDAAPASSELTFVLRPGRELRVRVNGEDGVPVADARIHLTTIELDESAPESADSSFGGNRITGATGEAVFEAVPDGTFSASASAEGYRGMAPFRLQVADTGLAVFAAEPDGADDEPAADESSSSVGRPLRAAESANSANSAGFAVPVELAAAVRGDALEVSLSRGAALEVIVTEQDGRPAVGVPLMVGHQQGVTTDDRGMATVSGWAEGTSVRVAVLAANGVRQEEDVQLEGLFTRASIVLNPLHTLRGQVLEQDGSALANASVAAVASDRALVSTVTDALGAFLIDELPAVELVVTARAPGKAPGAEEVDLQAGNGEVVIRLGAAAAIEGRVVRADGSALDQPVDDWQIAAVPLDQLRAGDATQGFLAQLLGGDSMAQVALDGRFTLSDLRPGGRMLSLRRGSLTAASQFVELAAGEVAEVELRLDERFEVSGFVLEAGVGVVGVQVSASSGIQVVTGGDGSFLLRDVPAGEIRIDARSQGALLTRRDLVLNGNVHDLVLESEVATLRGVVRDATTGVELPRVQLLARGPSRSDGNWYRSRDDGGFRMRLMPGEHQLEVIAEGYQVARTEIRLTSGELATIDFDLVRGNEIALRVVTEDGTPVPNPQVWEVVEERLFHRQCVEAAGETGAQLGTSSGSSHSDLCRLRGLGSAPSLVVTASAIGAGHPAVVPAAQVAAAGGAPVMVRLRRTGVVRIFPRSLLEEITSGMRRPATLRVISAATGDALRLLDRQSRTFRREKNLWFSPGDLSINTLELPSGSWVLEVRSDEGQVWQAQVHVLAGEAVSVTL